MLKIQRLLPAFIAGALTWGVTSAQADVVFSGCSSEQLQALQEDLPFYLAQIGALKGTEISVGAEGALSLSLKNAPLQGTLRIHEDLALNVSDVRMELPLSGGGTRSVVTVSQAEVAYSMAAPGRTIDYRNGACLVEAFKDEVGLRQNIVAWAESLEWEWPEGGPAKWNTSLWDKGTPLQLNKTREALWDVFSHQQKYSIGCYTASKLVYTFATLDYFHRVAKKPHVEEEVLAKLLRNSDPLTNIEPGAMWFFEEDHTAEDTARQGKLLQLTYNVPAKNFIPGDWSYFMNTDKETYEKTGYEGSNAIYLGRGKFDDYYNDNNHSYTYREKINEVYQWRNKVFSRSRDASKIEPLSPSRIEELSRTPYEGGLLFDFRAVPYQFGYESK